MSPRTSATVTRQGEHALVSVYAERDGDAVFVGVLPADAELAHVLAARLGGEAGPHEVTVTPEIAAHVLWLLGEVGGKKPRPYIRALLDALDQVETREDTLRLAVVYPGYAAAVYLGRDLTGGVARLQSIAARAEKAAVSEMTS